MIFSKMDLSFAEELNGTANCALNIILMVMVIPANYRTGENKSHPDCFSIIASG